MSFPKQTIWQAIRADCLDAIPEGSSVNQKAPISLALWQTRGCFSVQAMTSKRFELVASSVDLGSALLTDAEHLLDGAAEHQVTLWRHINSSDWLSPAWLGVTLYYWAYFLVLALTRLTGRTTWYLTDDIVSKLKTLAPATPRAPGQGCFRFACQAHQSATDRLLHLSKTGGRVHDEAWRLWFGSCRDKVRALSAGSSGTPEARLFTAITHSANKLGDDWPSAFRNMVNYKAGFAYSAVRREVVLKSLNFLRSPKSYDFHALLDRLENGVAGVRNNDSLGQAPQNVLQLMAWLTFAMHLLATELHRELVDRQKLDPRWKNSRVRFLRENSVILDGACWPT